MKPKTNPEKPQRAHLAIVRPGFEDAFKSELFERFKLESNVLCRAGVGTRETLTLPKLTETVFARQYLPRALRHQGASDDMAKQFVSKRVDVLVERSNRQKGLWTLHAYSTDNDDALARARSISKSVLAHIQSKHKEFFKRYISKDEFARTQRSGEDFILQIYCPVVDDLWFSISRIDDGVSLFEGGFRPMKTLAQAPSRSASKLEEALNLMGRHPSPGDTAVDLGAAPGGWSLVLARYGANVKAIDHAELSLGPKVKLKGHIEHIKANGLKFIPEEPVDWMVCDMVMGSQETLKILAKWLDAGAMRQFIVNVKLPKQGPWKGVSEAIQLTRTINDFKVGVRQLIHDRSEITIFGYKIS
jgi:23S rRNA C2498 (ribose-2'-O)-methylase RlmM